MPSVQTATVGPNALIVCEVIDSNGVTSLLASAIPNTLLTITDVENWINANWCNQFTLYQVFVHVQQLSPIKVNMLVLNNGVTPPVNWWLPR